MSNATLQFYNEQARRYAELRARPIQVYTDAAERAALEPYALAASDILDLGCGEGRLTRWIAAMKRKHGGSFRVHGVDFSPEMIAQALRFNGDLPATYGVGDAMALEFPDGSFDLVASCTAPNNFPTLEGALSEIHRVLRPGGIFFATIINAEETARFARYVYYAPYFLWRGVKRLGGGAGGYHRVLYSRDELERLLAGRFETVELSGMRVVSDFVPEFPLNVWPPLFPIMRGILKFTRDLDRRLERHPHFGRHARFHLVVARAVK
ncbi:class I SAM-dependent methyltransferase [Bradyrhizobium sp. sBnM-33]|uniref:class I SAM-dependent methyltransferase n=1 Tax=Bradyrhizobium sp. sBnM-33 TaxID=2831780 RepID=UPI001BCADB02|nr:class I SAM-dependent methyltransferase [Bradyrhizobium sp. sBnM-33]WOH48816.1 class I SAM-dependent methyltransferase [Bradyrhizobium sp. sBnM-33]